MAKSKAKKTQRTFANKQETIEKKQEDKQEKTEEKQESKGLILSTDNLASASWEEENGNFNLENLLKSMSNREKIYGKYSEEKESIFRKKHRKNDKKHLKDRDNLRERDKEKEKSAILPELMKNQREIIEKTLSMGLKARLAKYAQNVTIIEKKYHQ